MMLYTNILNKVSGGKMIALLIDPDKQTVSSLKQIVEIAREAGIDFFLMGGSIIAKSLSDQLRLIKDLCSIPVFLFPGNLLQLCNKADGILLLSLLSGRNAEFLIGNHVNAAPFLKNSGMEIIPTGYLLIDTGRRTSVEYMSNTVPIPANKPDIAVATAMAGEMLGQKLIYLEGGSGAEASVSLDLIREVKKNITIPLIVGGGIRNQKTAGDIFEAGADIIVIGSVVEENPEALREIVNARNLF